MLLCMIESDHNQQVVTWVAAEVPSTEYTKHDVKSKLFCFSGTYLLELKILHSCLKIFSNYATLGALQTYRKTLRRTPKDGEHEQTEANKTAKGKALLFCIVHVTLSL